MNSKEHAIVIGGSISGMISAQILSKYYKKVTIVERDDIADHQATRRGTPQAIHPHILLAKGTSVLSSIFPEFINDLAKAGAVYADIGHDSEHFVGNGLQPRFKSDLACYFCSRTLLESVIKRQILKNDRINFLNNMAVTGLVSVEKKINGITLSNPSSQPGMENGSLYGDLIVDASGKNSKAMDWMSEAGYGKPKEIHVNSMIGYASRYYKIPKAVSTKTKLIVVFNKPPYFPKMGGIISIEDDKWLVGLYSIGKDLPPTNEDDFMDFAKNLAHSKVYDMIKDAEPISQIYGHRIKGSRRICFEDLDSWPSNFIVVGDAVCTFNPFYGQGMTVAALGGKVLDECVKKYHGTANFGHVFQKKLSKMNLRPWLLATGEDFRWPTTTGTKPNSFIRMIQRYADSVLEITPCSKTATKSFQAMMHMTKNPLFLFHPVIMMRIFWRVISSKVSRNMPR